MADLSIIEGDPLKDIWMTQNVKMVFMDGKVIDYRLHAAIRIRSRPSTPIRRCRRTFEISPLFLPRRRPDDIAEGAAPDVAVPSRDAQRPAAADDATCHKDSSKPPSLPTRSRRPAPTS